MASAYEEEALRRAACTALPETPPRAPSPTLTVSPTLSSVDVSFTKGQSSSTLGPASPTLQRPLAPPPSPLSAKSSPFASQISHESPVSDAWSDPVNSVELGGSPVVQNAARDWVHVGRQRRPSNAGVPSGSPGQDVSRGPFVLDDEEEQSELEGTGELSEEEEGEYDFSRDDAEDVMNIPGKLASSPRPLDLRRVSLGGRKPTPEELHRLNMRRRELERELEQQRVKQNQETIEDLVGDEELEHDGIALAAEELDALLRSHDEEPVGDIYKRLAESALTVSEQAFDGPASASNHDAAQGLRTTPPSDIPMPSSDIPTSPSVVTTPGGRHIQFAAASTIQETPFTKTLNYFKQYKGKENSPSKSRRNASLPEEIAELAKEVQEQDEEENLDKYRDEDLAPMDPVMENRMAGDLVMLGTPTKPRVEGILGEGLKRRPENGSAAAPDAQREDKDSIKSGYVTALDRSATELGMLEVERAEQLKPSLVSDLIAAQLAASPDNSSAPATPGNEKEAGVQCLEKSDQPAVDLIKDNLPQPAPNENDDAEQRQLILYQEDPVFVRVIAMLPAAMFWVVAHPVTKYSVKAFDTLVEKFSGLPVHDAGIDSGLV